MTSTFYCGMVWREHHRASSTHDVNLVELDLQLALRVLGHLQPSRKLDILLTRAVLEAVIERSPGHDLLLGVCRRREDALADMLALGDLLPPSYAELLDPIVAIVRRRAHDKDGIGEVQVDVVVVALWSNVTALVQVVDEGLDLS